VKMRVREYDAHKLRDPYKFWSRLLDTPPRHKRRSVATYTYVTRIDDCTLQFYLQYRPDSEKQELCRLADNDTWTLTVLPKDVVPGISNRLRELTGVWPGWNKKNFWKHENPCRLHESWAKNLPYEPGAQVYKGKVVDPDKYVDRVRTIEAEPAKQTKRKLRKIYELAPIMARLLDANDDQQPIATWSKSFFSMKRELFDNFDPDNVTAMDAERVYLLGKAATSRKQRWQYTPGKQHTVIQLETEAEYRKRCIVSGLRKLREHVYSKEGVYQYKPVKN
jgi:hypothetical protein